MRSLGPSHLSLLLASCALLVGCTTAGSNSSRTRAEPSGQRMSYGSSTRDRSTPTAAETRTTRVKTQVLPLGFIPYDNNTLPLVSPDGRFVATQTGIAPTWDTILAEPEATIPYATRVEVYELGGEWGQSPNLAFALDQPAMIGRACDADGFLIEAPQEDGSRWIGHANWQTGNITWLVRDDAVNAFATLGPDGRLAWSRRAADAEHFDLVIRHGSRDITIPSTGNDWLFPTFSGHRDGLFVMSIARKFLDLTFAQASSPQAFQQSIRRLPIKRNATRWAAYQAIAAYTSVAAGPMPTRDELMFHYMHETFPNQFELRSAIWRPLGGNSALTLLHSNSYAAVPTEDGQVLTATEDALLLQDPADLKNAAELLAGLLIPRSTPLGDWPFLLLETEEGRVALTAMRLLPDNVNINDLLAPGTDQ